MKIISDGTLDSYPYFIQNLYYMNSFKTHYENLQVLENSSTETIYRAYKQLHNKLNPDKFSNRPREKSSTTDTS
mgnify:CR=1 FL=1